MYPTTLALVLAFWFLNSALLVDAGLYVIKPSLGSKCHGGQKCTVEWLDDGIRPLLTAIGVCTVGLYTGKQQLVQELAPVDVSTRHSITFTPNPRAGPNSDSYYIGIISTSFKQPDNIPYAAFSPFFSIDLMSGSFQFPLASAISTKPLPSSLAHSSSSTTILSTITVGTLSISLPTPDTPDTLSSDQPSSTSSTTRTSSPSSSPARMMTLTSPSASPSPSLTSTSSTLFTLSSLTSTSTSTSDTGTGTVTGSTSPLAPPASTSASSGALGPVPIPLLSTLFLPLVLSSLL